jgi:selenocysteine lyase/cysteine desulfurase
MEQSYPPFGKEMKEKVFLLDKGYTNLNHGSFGAVPREIIVARREFEDECESNPDKWIYGGYQKYIWESRDIMGRYLNADPHDLCFTESASTAINSILRSADFKPGDKVLYLSTAYEMVKNTLRYLVKKQSIEVVEISVVFPGQRKPPTGIDGTLLESIEKALIKDKSKIKIAIFSHITSKPGIILPIPDLCRLCKRYGVSVLIDGAHALGHIPVDMKSLEESGMDYWVGNGHKWFYTPKGSAVLWVTKSKQEGVVPSIISTFFPGGVEPEPSKYLGTFQYTGTRDYTAFCTFKAAMKLREKIGDENIKKYNHDLAIWTQNYLAKRWNSEVLVPDSMTGFMANVRIPQIKTEDQMIWLRRDLLRGKNISFAYSPIIHPITKEGSFWLRISAQIYVEKNDIENFAKAIEESLTRLPSHLPPQSKL